MENSRMFNINEYHLPNTEITSQWLDIISLLRLRAYQAYKCQEPSQIDLARANVLFLELFVAYHVFLKKESMYLQ